MTRLLLPLSSENIIEGIHSLLEGCECYPKAEDHHQPAATMTVVSLLVDIVGALAIIILYHVTYLYISAAIIIYDNKTDHLYLFIN